MTNDQTAIIQDLFSRSETELYVELGAQIREGTFGAIPPPSKILELARCRRQRQRPITTGSSLKADVGRFEEYGCPILVWVGFQKRSKAKRVDTRPKALWPNP